MSKISSKYRSLPSSSKSIGSKAQAAQHTWMLQGSSCSKPHHQLEGTFFHMNWLAKRLTSWTSSCHNFWTGMILILYARCFRRFLFKNLACVLISPSEMYVFILQTFAFMQWFAPRLFKNNGELWNVIICYGLNLSAVPHHALVCAALGTGATC